MHDNLVQCLLEWMTLSWIRNKGVTQTSLPTWPMSIFGLKKINVIISHMHCGLQVVWHFPPLLLMLPPSIAATDDFSLCRPPRSSQDRRETRRRPTTHYAVTTDRLVGWLTADLWGSDKWLREAAAVIESEHLTWGKGGAGFHSRRKDFSSPASTCVPVLRKSPSARADIADESWRIFC